MAAGSPLDLALRLRAEGFEAAAKQVGQVNAAVRETAAASGAAAPSVTGLATGVEALGRSLVAVAGAISLGAVLRAVVDEAAEMERQLARTEAMVRATGEAAGYSAAELHEQARALGYATLQSTEGVLQAQQVMMSFRSVTGETFSRAIELAADMASLFGGSLTGSVTQLGKALEDPVQGLTALRRVGVSFTEDQRELITRLHETGHAAEAQAVILDVLASQLGGVARAEANSFAGAMDTLGQRVQEAKLAIAGVFGVLERWGALVNRASDAIAAFTAALAAGRFDAIVGPLNLALDALQAAVNALFAVLDAGASVLGAILAAVSLIPTPLLAAAAAAWALHAAWVPLTALAATLASAIYTLVMGTLSRSILLWGQAAAAVGTLTTALKALWVVMLANPVTAVLAGVTAAIAGFTLYRAATAETIESLRALRTATDAQVTEIERLRAAMASAAPGSEAYTEAARRLARLVPGLNLELNAHGELIANLGAGYEANGRLLDEYIAKQRALSQESLVRELQLAYREWENSSAAVQRQTAFMAEQYGQSEETRTGLQNLTLALARWGGRLDAENAKSIAFATAARESGEALREVAIQARESGLSIDDIAAALDRFGASREQIADITRYLNGMDAAAESALAGLSGAERAAAQAGQAAAAALEGTITAVGTAIDGLDARIQGYHKDLAAAQQAEAAGWKAVGEAARGTYDAALEEIDRYADARWKAQNEQYLSERERIAEQGRIERDAAAAKLAALQDYQREALRLIDAEGRRRIEVARATGGDVRAAELETLRIKRDTLRTIEAEYRRHIDSLNAEAFRHYQAVVQIEDEIRSLKMSTEDRIRELQRGAMSDVDAYYDARKQAAEKAAAAERAIAEGNFELAKELAKQSADLYARYSGAVMDEAGREIISRQQAAAESVRGYTAAAKLQERALVGMAEAQQRQAAAAADAAEEAKAGLAALGDEADSTADKLDREIRLQLDIDTDAVDVAVAHLQSALADRAYLVEASVDLERFRASLADVATLAREDPVTLAVTVGEAEGALDALKQQMTALGDLAPVPVQVAIEPALEAVRRVRAAMDDVGDSEVTLSVIADDSRARAVLQRLQQPTFSYHTIYVREVRQNAAGGPVRGFAHGGVAGFPIPAWSRVPGSGNTDSVPAALEAGSFVLRKRATQYYGRLLDGLRFASGGLVPSLLMPGEALFRPREVNRWGQGLFEALNRMAIPREQLAAALGGLTAPVARFSAGGAVALPSGGAAPAREVVDITLRVGTQAVRLSGARDQAAALASALRELARAG